MATPSMVKFPRILVAVYTRGILGARLRIVATIGFEKEGQSTPPSAGLSDTVEGLMVSPGQPHAPVGGASTATTT